MDGLPLVILDMCFSCVTCACAYFHTPWKYDAARLTRHWNPAHRKSSKLAIAASAPNTEGILTVDRSCIHFQGDTGPS